MQGNLFEQGQDIHPLFFQQDVNTDVTGDWIDMKHYARGYILFIKAGTEDVDDLAVQVQQATDNAAAGAKALSVARCWYKTGTMTSQTVWTAVTVGGASSPAPDDLLGVGSALPTGATRVVDDVGTSALYLLVEVKAEDMDSNNGFDHVTLFVEGDNLDNACLASALWIGSQGFLMQNVPPSPLG